MLQVYGVMELWGASVSYRHIPSYFIFSYDIITDLFPWLISSFQDSWMIIFSSITFLRQAGEMLCFC